MRDHDRVVAGASCIIWGGRSQAHVVWVDQTLRHRGLGPRLVAEAEHAARRRDRMAMDLAYDVLTGDDYEHLGFRTVATIENCPTPHHHPLVLQRPVAGLVILKTFGRAGLSPIP